jgi:hypothetical protein
LPKFFRLTRLTVPAMVRWSPKSRQDFDGLFADK